MRITGGQFARLTIEGPPAKERRVRPTTDRVREAVFSALGSRMSLSDAVVLDLFAGTGALGLEALSRGASTVTFVEQHPQTLALCKRNASALDVSTAASFRRADAFAFLSSSLLAPEADLIFADPPYNHPRLAELPALVRPHLAPGGVFVLEYGRGHSFEDAADLIFSRAYGETHISMFSSPT